MSSIALFWHYTSSEVQFLDLVFLQPREFVLCGSNCGSSALSTRFCTVKFSLFTFKKCFVDLKLTLPMVKSICKKATTIFSPYDIRLDEDSHSSTTTTYFCEENWLLCLNHSTQSHFEDKNKICRSRRRSRRSLYNFGKHSDHFL